MLSPLLLLSGFGVPQQSSQLQRALEAFYLAYEPSRVVDLLLAMCQKLYELCKVVK